ncbi:MAG: PhnD/SsuA/transferrin family substrate-binding protein [Candidatus Schekmanbacteria bacterium]|nr:PhnD/SsuA/transferrin family substrate-binding protein [Candidatus Schekmanbacteria bacterium]
MRFLVAPVAAVLLLSPFMARAQEVREAIYYFPDTVAQNRTDTAALAQEWIDAELVPALGFPLTLRYFARLPDLEKYLDECARRAVYPVWGTIPAELAVVERARWGLDMVAYTVRPGGSPTHTLSVVISRQSAVRGLGELAGKTLIAPDYWGTDTARFERKVLAEAGGKVELHLADLGDLKLSDSSISALLGVYYGEGDAALVSNRAFEVLRERSAAIWRAMHVVHESPPIPLAVVVLFPTTSPREREILLRKGLKLHDTPTGRRWFDYVRLDRLVPGAWRDLYTAAELDVSAPRSEAPANGEAAR